MQTKVHGYLKSPDNTTLEGIAISFVLKDTGVAGSTLYLEDVDVTAYPDQNGYFEVNLWTNLDSATDAPYEVTFYQNGILLDRWKTYIPSGQASISIEDLYTAGKAVSGAATQFLTISQAYVTASEAQQKASEALATANAAKTAAEGISLGAIQWGDVTNKPSTLAGYGITDSDTRAEADTRYASLSGATFTGSLKAPNVEIGGDNNGSIEIGSRSGGASTPFIDFHTGNPNADFDARIMAAGFTTGSGYGGAYLDVEALALRVNGVPVSLNTHTHAFSSITNTPTTLVGYGITDAYTKAETDSITANLGGTSSGGFVAVPYISGRYYNPIFPFVVAAATTKALVVGTANIAAFSVNSNITVNALSFVVTAAGTTGTFTAKMALYQSGSDNKPSTLLAQCEVAGLNSAGGKEGSIPPTQLQAGKTYWIAILSNTNATIRALASGMPSMGYPTVGNTANNASVEKTLVYDAGFPSQWVWADSDIKNANVPELRIKIA